MSQNKNQVQLIHVMLLDAWDNCNAILAERNLQKQRQHAAAKLDIPWRGLHQAISRIINIRHQCRDSSSDSERWYICSKPRQQTSVKLINSFCLQSDAYIVSRNSWRPVSMAQTIAKETNYCIAVSGSD